MHNFSRPTREQDELDCELHDLYIDEFELDIEITELTRLLRSKRAQLYIVQDEILRLENKDV